MQLPITKRHLRAIGLPIAVVLAGTTMLACSSEGDTPGGEEIVNIRFSTGGAMPPNEMELAIFNGELEEAGVLPNIGEKYTLDMTLARGTPEAQTLLISGEVEFATLAFSTIATTHIQNAIPDGFSIVAGHFVDGETGKFSNTYLTLDDSGINTIQDVVGRTVAVNSIGSAVDVIFRAALLENGIDPERDVEFVEIGFGAMGQALRDGRADLAAMVQPFQALEEQEGGVRVLTTAFESVGKNSAIAVVARNDFLQQHPDAARAFLEDWVTGLQYLDDPANRDETMEIIFGVSRTEVAVLDLFYGTSEDYYRDQNGCPSAEALQNGVDAMFKVGYLNQSVTIADLIDVSYLPNPGACS